MENNFYDCKKAYYKKATKGCSTILFSVVITLMLSGCSTDETSYELLRSEHTRLQAEITSLQLEVASLQATLNSIQNPGSTSNYWEYMRLGHYGGNHQFEEQFNLLASYGWKYVASPSVNSHIFRRKIPN